MVYPGRLRNVVKLLFTLIVCLVVVLVYVISSAIHTRHTTGIFDVRASQQRAVISISQKNTDAEVIGIGTARVRLYPGDYLVSANGAGNHTVKLIHVSTNRTLSINLNTTQNSNLLPSVDNVSFTGLDVLIQNGLTSTQVTNLKQLFYTYNPKEVQVHIDTDSVVPGPHNPNSADPTFSLNFTGTIDSTPYKATVSYVDLTNISLVLYSQQSGAQIYSGSSD